MNDSLLITGILFFVSLVDANGDFHIKIINDTNNSAIKKIYIVVKGINPSTNQQCFVALNSNDSVGTYVDITKQTDSTEYSYDYTYFKNNTVRLPKLISGRIFISLNTKLILPIVGDDAALGIADPSPYNASDPNYNIFFDKVEFTYIDNNTWINPTAVDFFALPLTIEQNGQTYGVQHARKEMIASVINVFGNAPNNAWQKLVVKNSNGDVLRILAPGRDDSYFDRLYLTGSAYNYVADIWNYYKKYLITIDCSELQGNPEAPLLGDYYFTGSVVDNNFIFTNKTKDYTVTIEKPSSNSFFLASQGAFNATNNTPKAIIVRNLSAAWCVGLLPAEDGAILNRNYFNKHQDVFYSDNPRLASNANNGPYYNLYGKVFHLFSKSIYTWAYDDAFGYDGTNASTDSNPTTLTIWNMSGMEI